MALIDYFKSPFTRADEALGEKFDYRPISKRIKNIIPPNIRQFTYDILGGEKDFTEKDLSESYKKELKGIAEESLLKGKKVISYEDYKGGTAGKPLFLNLLSKNYNLKTLIGNGKVKLNKKGEIVVTDKFNFNDAKDINSLADVKSMFTGIIGAYKKGKTGHGAGHGLYSAVREAGKWLGSGPGEGSDIKINLGKMEA